LFISESDRNRELMLAFKESSDNKSKLIAKLEKEINRLHEIIDWYECRDFALTHPQIYEKCKQSTLLAPYCVY